MYQLNLREVTFTLSEALDFVGIDDTLHGKRVAYMASKVAEALRWTPELIDHIIFVGMLHDCGVSSSTVHGHLINELDWSHAQEHAERGYHLLKKVAYYENCALPVRYHHTHWDALPDDLDESIAVSANLIYLVDRVDALQATSKAPLLEKRQHIFGTLRRLQGVNFSPELVEIFCQVAEDDAFWYFLEEFALRSYFHSWIEDAPVTKFSFDQAKQLSYLFAAAVDAKSPYTAAHSIGVANVARVLSSQLALSESEQNDLELAGLFHDLGKLKVPDEILNKPASMDIDERIQMNRHGFDSNIILQQISGFQHIALLASQHHETLDGSGYPYHLSAEQISLSARILSVADIFQALVQNRPYRKALSAKEALAIMRQMVDQNKIDADVVTVLDEHLDSCYEAALTGYDVDNVIAISN